MKRISEKLPIAPYLKIRATALFVNVWNVRFITVMGNINSPPIYQTYPVITTRLQWRIWKSLWISFPQLLPTVEPFPSRHRQLLFCAFRTGEHHIPRLETRPKTWHGERPVRQSCYQQAVATSRDLGWLVGNWECDGDLAAMMGGWRHWANLKPRSVSLMCWS